MSPRKSEFTERINVFFTPEQLERIKAEADTIRDSLKNEMLERDTEELAAGQYIVRWTSIISNRFDSTSFKKAYGDLYKSFTKQSTSRRFTISA